MKIAILPRILTVSALLAGVPQPSWAADDKPQVVRNVTYAAPGGESLAADIYLPVGTGPFPTVLVVHGGAWIFGNKSHLGFVGQQLARHGYAAMLINYRLAPKHKFPAQFEDCQSALQWMNEHADQHRLDVDRVAGWGYSAGGHLVALLGANRDGETADAGARQPNKPQLKAVVAGGAPCDFREVPAKSSVLAYWLGGSRMERPEIYDLASPRRFVSADDPPMCFYHGEQDQLVNRADPTAMMSDLKKAGVVCELHLLPGKGHVEAMFDAAGIAAGLKFLDGQLKK